MNTALKVDDYWLIIEDVPLRNLKEEVRFALLDNCLVENLGGSPDKAAYKVIATSKKIGELPLFDVPDEWENGEYDLKQDLIILCEAWMKAKFPGYVDASYLLIKEVVMPRINKAKEKYQFTEEDMLDCATKFFYHWWNTKENNTEQCFDDWFPTYLASLTKPKQYEVEIEHTEEKVKILNWKEQLIK